MEHVDRLRREWEKFERKIAVRGFRKHNRKYDKMDVWSSRGVEFHMDSVGFFHYIDGVRVKGCSWDRAYLYEF